MVTMALRTTTLVFLVASALGTDLDAQTMPTVRDLIDGMRARHATGAPLTRTFVQETINHRTNGTVDTTIWYEAMMPGYLRIDVAPIDAGNGILWIGSTRHTMRGFEVVDRRPDVNPLMLVMSDLLGQPADRTLFVLDSIGIDTTLMHARMWEGKPVVVVGAEAGDEKPDQFWVEFERLVPVRLFQRIGPQGQAQLDARIGGYQQFNGRWIETDVLIYVNGSLWQEERYSNVRVGVELDASLFDPEQWRFATPYWK